MSYTTLPPITTTTEYGAIESYSAIQSAPALLTRFTPPDHCSTDWYWDTAALRSSNTAFSNTLHNPQWSTCQPYNVSGATYSAGVCPVRSEFKSVTQVSWDGVSDSYYVGACCESTASYQTYESGDATGLYGCVATVTSSSVVATWVQENNDLTAVTSAGPITVIAQPLYIVWHQSDTLLHAESDARSLQAAMGMASIPSSTMTSIPAPTSTSDETTGSTMHGIPPGAITGIVVGFALGLIIVAVLGYFAFARRRRKRKQATTTATSQPPRPEDNFDVTQPWSADQRAASRGGPRLQVNVPNSTHKSPSLVELHTVDSAGSRTPQSAHTPQILSRAKEQDEMYTVEQKMLLR